ncbi:hypothetical protein B6U98_05845 [Thermoplasmatales archaeon ex4572_165]|nr:MAG: hypothetical protein B6U98_05845 [Thermoplasmatales archaeon ex4572_165]RLF59221.1 MAG: hypothetical protein DRN27_03280 [Thermoplasmata archaeon]
MKKINKTTSKDQTDEEQHSKKKTLSGFDMSKYVAKPIDSGIVLHRPISTIPVKKPNSQQFFRIHPTMEILVNVIEWKDEGTFYLIDYIMAQTLVEQTKRVILHVGIFLNGNPFLFPVPQPDERGNWNSWHKSRSRVVVEAKENWVRIQSDKSIGGYQVILAEGNIVDPKWPDLTIEQYLSTAFTDAIINDENHSIVKQLRGNSNL